MYLGSHNSRQPANSMAPECGGPLNHSDFLKAIKGPYKQGFSLKQILKAFEVTGTWPVNQDKIGPDKTATSIGLSLHGEATIPQTL